MFSQATFNFEVQSAYTLRVTVVDPEGLNVTGDVTVRVLDMNDPPILTVSSLNVSENLPAGTVVNGSVTA